MKVLIIDNAELVDAAFNQPLIDCVARLADCDVVNYRHVPARRALFLSQYNAIILSGVPVHYSFETIDERAAALSWIKHAKLPVLGVCLGHQIIARMFGGTVVTHEPEVGQLPATVLRTDEIFGDMHPAMFESSMLHRASVTLPTRFQVLARTDECANVVMKHRHKAMYGLQCHPELSSDGRKLLYNFVQLASLHQTPSLQQSFHAAADTVFTETIEQIPSAQT